jgi:hypothetical protein
MGIAMWGLYCLRGRGGFPKWVQTFIKSVSLVVEWERSGLCIFHIALLCWVVQMLLRVVFVHMERKWKHVSVSSSGHRLQRGERNWVSHERVFFGCPCIVHIVI